MVLVFASWVNRRQQVAIEHLLEENRVLREKLGGRRLRLTGEQRRRLAVMCKALGRKEPALERSGRTRWSTFLKAHWDVIAAADFFSVEVVTSHGLVRYLVLGPTRAAPGSIEPSDAMG